MYMYKKNLVLNNLQWLIYYKTKQKKKIFCCGLRENCLVYKIIVNSKQYPTIIRRRKIKQKENKHRHWDISCSKKKNQG